MRRVFITTRDGLKELTPEEAAVQINWGHMFNCVKDHELFNRICELPPLPGEPYNSARKLRLYLEQADEDLIC